MQETIITVLTIVIPSLVSIAGFFVSYFVSKKSMINEIYKTKNISASDRLNEYLESLLNITRNVDEENEKERIKKLDQIFTNILIYGTKDLISIACSYKEYIFQNQGNFDVYYLFAYVGLMMSQLKYDVSGEYIKSDIWFRYTIKDYNKAKEPIIKLINKIVVDLKLNNALKC